VPCPAATGYRSTGGPDERGHFGIFGGRFVAETLMPLILDLEKAYDAAKADPAFQAELEHLNTHYAGRPSPLYFAERLTELGGAKIYFKRDELNHTGSAQDQQLPRPDPARPAHGQDAHHRRDRRRPARRRHRHGVRALRPALRRLHGRHRRRAPAPNVFRMKLLGAEVGR
jgi:tryptophan synthase beta chain